MGDLGWVWQALRDANWATIGQVLGALFTFVTAGVALITAKTAQRIAKQGVEATKRQTSISAMQELWKDYAGPDMYKALNKFGSFKDNEADVTQNLENDSELASARRQIHHHFKQVWALRRAGVISDPDLLLLTSAHSGYELWHDKVLPATKALGLHTARAGSFDKADEWAPELIKWVKEADRSHSSDDTRSS